MPMKKITFNALLNHKAHNYKPMQIEVEKVIPLYGKRFEQMRDHPLDDCPEIIENRELMYMEGKLLTVLFFLMPTAAMESLWKPRVQTTLGSHSSFRMQEQSLRRMTLLPENIRSMLS